ncbi:hypothetical protein ACLOJK_026057 [Asimina triloba]
MILKRIGVDFTSSWKWPKTAGSGSLIRDGLERRVGHARACKLQSSKGGKHRLRGGRFSPLSYSQPHHSSRVSIIYIKQLHATAASPSPSHPRETHLPLSFFSPSHFSAMAKAANFDPSSDEAPSNGSISSDEEQRNEDTNPEDDEELEAVGRTASSDEDEAGEDAPTGDEDDDGSGKTDDEDADEVKLRLPFVFQLVAADFFFYNCVRVQFLGKEMIFIRLHLVFEIFIELSPFPG